MMPYYDANYPGLLLTGNLIDNPEIYCQSMNYSIKFELDHDLRYDYEEYKKVIDSSIRNFRHSRTYKHYKKYLYNLGLDRCFFHPYIQAGDEEGEEVATLEMHHCMLTIYDIAVLISEHYLNTIGKINEFDLSDMLKMEHVNNRVPLTILCKNCHQLYHDRFLYIPIDMIFGQWWELLEKYKAGWNENIVRKVVQYLERGIGENKTISTKERNKLLRLRQSIYDWSKRNHCTIKTEINTDKELELLLNK